uniref:Growth hormone-regulated TBC protein 1 n=1 Tax=Leptobrachium leishanense TaxID=445787 RepID=A0A8C5M508_9ANUR
MAQASAVFTVTRCSSFTPGAHFPYKQGTPLPPVLVHCIPLSEATIVVSCVSDPTFHRPADLSCPLTHGLPQTTLLDSPLDTLPYHGTKTPAVPSLLRCQTPAVPSLLRCQTPAVQDPPRCQIPSGARSPAVQDPLQCQIPCSARSPAVQRPQPCLQTYLQCPLSHLSRVFSLELNLKKDFIYLFFLLMAHENETPGDRIPRIDPYGFERPEAFDYVFYEDFYSRYLTVLTRRAAKWSKLLQKSTAVEKSLKDLNRTFPDNIQFKKTADPCLQSNLYNVLVAYGQHNRRVGYCQGMNFLTGYLLLVTKDEEKSFWLLDALIGRILPDYYSPAMVGLKTDQEVLGDLVKMKIPAVAELMERHGVMWTLVVSRWFICLFIDILPVETVLRIWDSLFYEGSKIIFRVALTLIKRYQAFILEARNFPDICEKFKEITKGKYVTECHLFMQVLFSRTLFTFKCTTPLLWDIWDSPFLDLPIRLVLVCMNKKITF